MQGVTIGAVAVLARAVFADILTAQELVRMGTLIGTMWGIGPVVGPLIGGYLQLYFGWKPVFIFSLINLYWFLWPFFLLCQKQK